MRTTDILDFFTKSSEMVPSEMDIDVKLTTANVAKLKEFLEKYGHIIRKIDISDCTNEGFKLLKLCPNLEDLTIEIYKSELSASLLDTFEFEFKNLTKLELGNVFTSGKTWQILSKGIKSLKSLNLTCFSVEKPVFDFIKQNRNTLKEIFIAYDEIEWGNRLFMMLRHSPLKTVGFIFNEYDTSDYVDNFIKFLRKQCSIEYLSYTTNENKINRRLMKTIATLTQLRALELSADSASGTDLLESLTNLKKLTLTFNCFKYR